ncbi:hypothetical protein [Microbacterium sp. 179-I 3D3 NHS]|uniref:hypothetical protein n=1 Tax=Microbacterium sp. 179-I 3D3 NHS TaxID=3142382 RepID=UPI0039A0B4D3
MRDAVGVHGAELVESAVCRWLDEVGTERAAVVSEALAADGVDGLAGLALAGPALGGLDADELAAMLAHLPDTDSTVAHAA